MDSRRQSIPELGAYRMVVTALRDLLKAEKTLAIVQEAGPDAERAVHLNALRSAIAQLKTMIPADSQSIADRRAPVRDRCLTIDASLHRALASASRARRKRPVWPTADTRGT